MATTQIGQGQKVDRERTRRAAQCSWPMPAVGCPASGSSLGPSRNFAAYCQKITQPPPTPSCLPFDIELCWVSHLSDFIPSQALSHQPQVATGDPPLVVWYRSPIRRAGPLSGGVNPPGFLFLFLLLRHAGCRRSKLSSSRPSRCRRKPQASSVASSWGPEDKLASTRLLVHPWLGCRLACRIRQNQTFWTPTASWLHSPFCQCHNWPDGMHGG